MRFEISEETEAKTCVGSWHFAMALDEWSNHYLLARIEHRNAESSGEMLDTTILSDGLLTHYHYGAR